jgi:hypothetical protein
LQIRQAGKQSRNVGFNNWNGLIEGECRNRVRSVTPDSGQLADLIDVPWKLPASYCFRGRMQVAGARVVTEPLPRVQDFRFRGRGQAAEIRKAIQPSIIVRNDGRDLRLLQHHFRNQNRVGITRATPGEVAALPAIPGEKLTPK